MNHHASEAFDRHITGNYGEDSVADTTSYLELIKDNIKVCLEDIGEGWSGEYDDTDPEDESLLRFSVYVLQGDEWEAVDDASYCTRLPATTNSAVLDRALQTLMNEFYGVLHEDPTVNVKGLGEAMSWLQPSDFGVVN